MARLEWRAAQRLNRRNCDAPLRNPGRFTGCPFLPVLGVVPGIVDDLGVIKQQELIIHSNQLAAVDEPRAVNDDHITEKTFKDGNVVFYDLLHALDYSNSIGYV
jgi:hypothetical protein